ncbi:MAG TPA: hypothetical protein VGM18_02645 [Candidatus Sulfotelmatobacter sp.]|jgi:hypothetical protein
MDSGSLSMNPSLDGLAAAASGVRAANGGTANQDAEEKGRQRRRPRIENFDGLGFSESNAEIADQPSHQLDDLA